MPWQQGAAADVAQPLFKTREGSGGATDPKVVANRLFKLVSMQRSPTTYYASYDATLLNTLNRCRSGYSAGLAM